MPDTRPIEDRFDVTYVRRTHWPDLANRWLMWLVVLGGSGALAMLAMRGDNRMYSSGSLAVVHASFGNDCAQCHQPAANGASDFFLPVADSACLRCHAAIEHSPNQTDFSALEGIIIPGHAEPVRMSSRCAACHIEHRGKEADLTIISDRMCVQCHSNLSLKGLKQHVEPAASPDGATGEVQP